MTVCPSWLATKSFTFEGGAFSSRLPPMKWSATLCFSVHVGLPLETGTVRLAVAVPLLFVVEGIFSSEMEGNGESPEG
jgi:hypothetical protein